MYFCQRLKSWCWNFEKYLHCYYSAYPTGRYHVAADNNPTNSKEYSSLQQEPLLVSRITVRGLLYYMKQIYNFSNSRAESFSPKIFLSSSESPVIFVIGITTNVLSDTATLAELLRRVGCKKISNMSVWVSVQMMLLHFVTEFFFRLNFALTLTNIHSIWSILGNLS